MTREGTHQMNYDNWNCIGASCNFATSYGKNETEYNIMNNFQPVQTWTAVLWSIFVGILQSWVCDT